MDPSNSGEFLLSFEKTEDTNFDDYRYANIKYLSFSQFKEETKKDKIVLYQDFNLNKGGIFWDGCFLLSKYFLQNYHNKENIDKSSILELGAGTSLPSIIFSLIGYKVVITDLKYLIEFVKKNVYMNIDQESQNVHVRELEWGKKEDIEGIQNIAKSFEFIICSELIYMEDTFDDLVKTLNEFSNAETKIIFSYRIRMKEKYQSFMEKLEKLFNINVEDDKILAQIHPNENLHLMIAQKK